MCPPLGTYTWFVSVFCAATARREFESSILHTPISISISISMLCICMCWGSWEQRMMIPHIVENMLALGQCPKTDCEREIETKTCGSFGSREESFQPIDQCLTNRQNVSINQGNLTSAIITIYSQLVWPLKYQFSCIKVQKYKKHCCRTKRK